MVRAASCELYFYADDLALLVSGKDGDEIESKLRYELQNVNNLLVENKLSIHLGKTESILFAMSRL